MNKRTSLPRLLLPLVLVGLILGTSCAPPAPAAQTPDATAEPTAEEIARATAALEGKLPIQVGSAEVFATLDQAVSHAGLVAVGTVVGKDQSFNGARDVNDPLKPSATLYVVAQLYRVKVDQYLKGSGPAEIQASQLEGMLDDTIPHTLVNIRAVQSNHKHIPLATGSRYAFLIWGSSTIPELGNLTVYHLPAAEPQRFLLKDDGTAQPETLDTAIKAQYSKQKADDLIGQLKAAISKK